MNQLPIIFCTRQAAPADATRFESWRATTSHKFLIVMALRPGDRNPLVCAMAVDSESD
jgi:hypothetical protein